MLPCFGLETMAIEPRDYRFDQSTQSNRENITNLLKFGMMHCKPKPRAPGCESSNSYTLHIQFVWSFHSEDRLYMRFLETVVTFYLRFE